jgi:hypothetical protein
MKFTGIFAISTAVGAFPMDFTPWDGGVPVPAAKKNEPAITIAPGRITLLMVFSSQLKQ